MTPIIDREIFFGNPEIINGQLSPDGKYLAFIKPYQGVRNIWVKLIDAPFEAAKPVTEDTTRPIPGYFWSRDSRYILYVQDKGGNEDFHVFALDPFSSETGIPEAKNLTPIEGVKAVIYRVPKSDPNLIFVGLNNRDQAWHDLYVVNISTGERTLQHKNTEDFNGWIFDLEDELRMATKSTNDGGTQLLYRNGSDWEPVYQCSVEENFQAIRFHKDGQHVYLETNAGIDTDLSKLVLFNPSDRSESFLESDPEGQVDFGKAIFSELSDELLATSYEGDKPRLYFRDEGLKADYELIKSLLPGAEVSITSSTKDEQLWLVGAKSDVDPGAAYLFDRQDEKVDLSVSTKAQFAL